MKFFYFQNYTSETYWLLFCKKVHMLLNIIFCEFLLNSRRIRPTELTLISICLKRAICRVQSNNSVDVLKTLYHKILICQMWVLCRMIICILLSLLTFLVTKIIYTDILGFILPTFFLMNFRLIFIHTVNFLTLDFVFLPI